LIVARLNVGTDQFPGEDSLFSANRPSHESGERRVRSHLEIVNVAAIMGSVSHGTRSNVQARIALKCSSRSLLKAIDRRVLTVDEIAYLGVVRSFTPVAGALTP
jgi:hypothetical protein